ncbi:MAG: TetR family transcriptional regulator [Myxococcota bacterium]
MPRRAGSDSADTVDRIVEASRAILVHRGASGLTFRAVAAAAEVSVGTIAYYFPDRTSLVEACLDAHHDWGAELVARVVRCHQEGAPIEAVVEEAVRAGHQALIADRETLRLRRIVALQEGELAPRRRVQALEPALDAAAAVLAARGIPRKEARLMCQSMLFLVARYALLSDEEICTIVQESEADEARQQAETHLVETALAHLQRLAQTDSTE